MSACRLTYVGAATLLIEVEGLRLLTDPVFDPPGERYSFGWGTRSRKLMGPALDVEAVGALDAVLLSHDQHADNGRASAMGALYLSGTTVSLKGVDEVARRFDVGTFADRQLADRLCWLPAGEPVELEV